MKPNPTVKNDILDDVFASVIALAPEFRAALERLHLTKRQEWGGVQPYVKHQCADHTNTRNNQIIRDYLDGESIGTIQTRYCISRARVWQIIKQK